MADENFRIMGNASQDGPQVGDLAPHFELRQTFERRVSLDELEKGSVVLCFYVFDFGDI